MSWSIHLDSLTLILKKDYQWDQIIILLLLLLIIQAIMLLRVLLQFTVLTMVRLLIPSRRTQRRLLPSLLRPLPAKLTRLQILSQARPTRLQILSQARPTRLQILSQTRSIRLQLVLRSLRRSTFQLKYQSRDQIITQSQQQTDPYRYLLLWE